MKKAKEPTFVQPNSTVTLLLDEVTAVKRRQDSLEEIVGCLADANDNLKTKNMAKFGSRRRRVCVYLALDGIRDANAVARVLRIERRNVDVEIRALKKGRLIDIADDSGRGVIWRKRHIDRITGLSDELMDKFNLDQAGRPRK